MSLHAKSPEVQARAKKAESKRKLDELQKDINSLESITEEQVQAERDPIPAMLQVSLCCTTNIHCPCLASLIHEKCCSKCLRGCKVHPSHKDPKKVILETAVIMFSHIGAPQPVQRGLF